MHGIHSHQATYVTETLASNFRSDLGRDRILAMVLLLMGQRWDLGNYLHECVTQGFLASQTLPEVFAEIIQLLDLYSEVQQHK